MQAIRQELDTHFSDLSSLPPEDRYAKKMWRFVGECGDRIDDLNDSITLADASFNSVLRYYGEEDRNLSSSEFYGLFRTFLEFYKARDSHSRLNSPDLCHRTARNRTRQSRRRERRRRSGNKRSKISRQPAQSPTRRRMRLTPLCLTICWRSCGLARGCRGDRNVTGPRRRSATLLRFLFRPRAQKPRRWRVACCWP